MFQRSWNVTAFSMQVHVYVCVRDALKEMTIWQSQ